MSQRPRLTAADIGGWLFTSNPRGFDPAARIATRCARPTYRLGLVRAGQPAILWVSGRSDTAPRPGVWMVGHTTGTVTGDAARPRIGLVMAPLDPMLPRERLRDDPRTAGMEVLRAPHASNPFVVSAAEIAAIRELTGAWPDPDEHNGPPLS
ncbi:hypothetical protein WEH80_36600 [Actinomycetes bacterium KLBMP 9759]